MAKKEIIHVNLAAANPNLSPATRFGNLVFVAGQTAGTQLPGRSAETFASKPLRH
jgi:enamine deaminase RidA (YjgF/YER057c/UK114 family)